MPRPRNRSAARDRATTSAYDSPNYDTTSVRRRWGLPSSVSNDEDYADYGDDRSVPTTYEARGPVQNFFAILRGLWDVGLVFVSVVQWLIKKTGYWLGVLILPGVFGPILAVKKVYGQTQRTYYATRYAKEQGYIEGLWPTVSHVLKKAFVVLVGLVTAGNVNLTEPVFGKQTTGSVRSTQRRNRGFQRQTKANGRTSPTPSATYSTAPTAPFPSDSESEEEQKTNETSSVGSLVFAPVRLSWDLVKMLMEVGLLGIYAVTGWTFGRYNVDEQGVMTRRRRGRGSAAASPRSQRGSNGRQENGSIFSGWWGGDPTNDQHHGYNLRSRGPTKSRRIDREVEEKISWKSRIVIAFILAGVAFAAYKKYQEKHEHKW